jgi:hypothetical protein
MAAISLLTLTLEPQGMSPLAHMAKQNGRHFPMLTLALEPLVDEPVEEGAAVVAEGGAGVRVHAEPVLRAVVLQIRTCTHVENFRSKRSKRDIFPHLFTLQYLKVVDPE